jgi:hypothetical protein
MDKDKLLLRSTLESCRAQLALLGVDAQSPLMEQVVFVLLATSDELPQDYSFTHDVASGWYFPRKNGQLLRPEGEALWFADETDARIYCWEQAIPSPFHGAPLLIGLLAQEPSPGSGGRDLSSG